jgi:hypothetical protein
MPSLNDRQLRSKLAHLGEYLPRELQRLPYELLLTAARLRVRRQVPRSDIWVRNSLATGHWLFAQSDLDLSIWVEGGALDAQRAWDAVRRHARWWLLGGEVHIYSARAVWDFLPYSNPWELARDPRLLAQTGWTSSAASDAQSTTFLVRQLIADNGLRYDPASRARRWENHLARMGHALPSPFDLPGLVELLRHYPAFAGHGRDELLAGLEAGPQGPLGRLLFPNQRVWFQNDVDGDRRFVDGLTPAVLDYLAATLDWEVWGLSPFTLVTAGHSLENLRGHARNMQLFLEFLPLPAARVQRLRRGFDRLLSYYGELATGASPAGHP